MINVFVSEDTRRWAHNLDDLLERWNLKHDLDPEDEPGEQPETVSTESKDPSNRQKTRYWRWRAGKGFCARLSELDSDDLNLLLSETIENRTEIMFQIRKWKGLPKNEKNHAWFMEADKLRGTYGAMILLIQAESSKRGKPKPPKQIQPAPPIGGVISTSVLKHALRSRRYEAAFIDVCRETLEPTLFSSLEVMAKERHNQNREASYRELDNVALDILAYVDSKSKEGNIQDAA